ncbi:MAG: Hsp20/alpha crystallin family protein [Alphaproteobacteria bacterium]
MPPTRRPNPRRAASPSEAVADIKAGLSSITQRLEEVFGAGTDGQARSFEFPIEGGAVNGVFGVSIRTGLGGVEAKTFGNLKPGPDGPEMADIREPLVDIYDEDGAVVVTVELPGVSEQDIAAALEGDVLRVEASGRRRYAAEIPLDAPVDAASMAQAFQNGILEIRLDRRLA